MVLTKARTHVRTSIELWMIYLNPQIHSVPVSKLPPAVSSQLELGFQVLKIDHIYFNYLEILLSSSKSSLLK